MKSELILPPRCTATLPDDTSGEHIVCEVKLDGSRYVMYIGAGVDPYERQREHALLSRQISKIDGKHVDKTGNLPHILKPGEDYGLAGTVLDGEVFLTDFPTTQAIMGSGAAVALKKQQEGEYLTYWAFDVPIFRGIDVRGRPLAERRKILEEVVKRIGSDHVRAMPQFPGSKAAMMFERITSKGGEGLIVKDTRCGYGIGWSKMKKSYEVSAFITGYKDGKGKYAAQVGSIEVSVLDDTGKAVAIGFASGFDDATRQAITADKVNHLHKAVDLYAQEISKDGRLRHPTFLRWRDDLAVTDCTMQKVKDDLAAQAKSKRKRGGDE